MLRWILILPAVSVIVFHASHAHAQSRMWTEENTGRRLDAELVSVQGESVTLRRAQDGRRFTLALSALCEEDRAFVAAWQAQHPGSSSNDVAGKVAEDRFKNLEWRNRDQIPVSGTSPTYLTGVDEAILAFMVEKGIGAAVAAVSRNGEPVYDRAFGFQDADLKKPLQAGVPMRLASISKPITAAAVKTAVKEGKLKLDDAVLDVLELGDDVRKKMDERWKAITIAHLLEHRGGWDSSASGDPVFLLPEIAKDQRVDLERLTPADMIAWMLTKPLDFDPGSKAVYSNFGFNLLARAMEKASGQTFEDYLNQTIVKQAKMTSLAVSRTEVHERPPQEIWYHFHPEYDRKPRVMPFRTELSYGSGALACSAADLCRFLETYWISGELRKGENYQYKAFGSMPGTTSICGQRPNGVNYAVLCNRRERSSTDWNTELADSVDAALDAAKWDGP